MINRVQAQHAADELRCTGNTEAAQILDALLVTDRRMRKALEFYALSGSYEEYIDSNGNGTTPVDDDGGERARIALCSAAAWPWAHEKPTCTICGIGYDVPEGFRCARKDCPVMEKLPL